MANNKMELKNVSTKVVKIRLESVTPMLQHKWSHKALQMIKDKKLGIKTKNRDICDPHQEFIDSTYFMPDGRYAIPAMSIKSAIVGAAHKDIGIEKTLIRKALFMVCDPISMLVPIECDPPEMDERIVRVGMDAADMRWRPLFKSWKCDVTFELDSDLLTPEALVNLLNRAGFGVGIGEMRPEKGGEYGRFRVDPNTPIQIL